MVRTVNEAFRDHWGYVEIPFEEELARFMNYMNNSEDFDPSLTFLAWEGDQVVGTSLCVDHISDDPELGWVGSLGVLRPWRRRGLGLALLQHSFVELYKRGLRRVGLGVDAGSLTGALRLYENAGMHSNPEREFAIWEKELRPGEDLATQSVQDH
jgi:GNAT superfamily N-acetyltransferase